MPDVETLAFEPGDGLMRDLTTSSSWGFAGNAMTDRDAEHLAEVVNDQPFWFARAVFRPDRRSWPR